MYANFIKSLREKLTSDVINIEAPKIEVKQIRQVITVLGVPCFHVTYDIDDKFYTVSESYNTEAVTAFGTKDSDLVIKNIVDAFEGPLKNLIDEATEIWENGEI